MKAAVFVSYLPPHIGGLEVVAEAQVKALARAGVQVTVVTSSCEARAGLQTTDDGYAVRRVPAWNYFEKKWGAVFPVFAPSLLVHSYRAVKRADVVHAHDAFYLTSLAAAVWARLLGKPLVLTQHVDMVPHPKKSINLAQKLVYATTGKFVLRSSSKIMVLNTRVRDFLLSKNVDAAKIVFLPNAIDTGTFMPAAAQRKQALRKKYGLPEDTIIALFVGRFVPKKGFMKLLDLAAIDGVTWVFAGGDAPAGQARADRHFLGAVGRRHMPDIFALSDIFVLPSMGEGFPVTIQEAMASGLAVITTDDPAYAVYSLDRRHVELVRPEPRAITAALGRLLAEPRALQRAQHYARRYACEQFNEREHSDALVKVYAETITPAASVEARSATPKRSYL